MARRDPPDSNHSIAYEKTAPQNIRFRLHSRTLMAQCRGSVDGCVVPTAARGVQRGPRVLRSVPGASPGGSGPGGSLQAPRSTRGCPHNGRASSAKKVTTEVSTIKDIAGPATPERWNGGPKIVLIVEHF